MSLGDVISFTGGSYDVRAIVDDRFVVRIRYSKTNSESYKIWTRDEREKFDCKNRQLIDKKDRNNQIYERRIAGETLVSLGMEYGIGPTRVGAICAMQSRKEKIKQKY
jgi:hypothetical protein